MFFSFSSNKFLCFCDGFYEFLGRLPKPRLWDQFKILRVFEQIHDKNLQFYYIKESVIKLAKYPRLDKNIEIELVSKVLKSNEVE